MAIRAIVPPELQAATDQFQMSPAIASGELVFLTGITGSDADGKMPSDPETQIRNAFEKIRVVLRAGGPTYRSIVEVTASPVGLRKHFDVFNRIRLVYLGEPYPAWTAVDVAGPRREGAIVEIRVIANNDSDG